MFRAIWPVMLVASILAGATIFGLSAVGADMSGAGLAVGALWGFLLMPWLFKRLDSAARRGEL